MNPLKQGMGNFQLYLKIGFFLFYLQWTSAAKTPLKEAPCHYKNTVILDPDYKFENGSYLYNNIIIPAHKTGTYNYKILFGDTKTPTEPYVRGCVCDRIPCISICCEDGGELHNGECEESPFEPESVINIINKQGKSVPVNLSDQFALQSFRPCKEGFYLQPESNDFQAYSIMENGSLFKIRENILLPKDKYCLSPRLIESEFIYTPVQCFLPNPVDTDVIKLNGIALLISVPFMILTIIVYLAIPNLRTIHGLSLSCYLGGLVIGYFSLAYLIFEPSINGLGCPILGYLAYFGFMSAFFWLSVISYDLYKNFYGCQKSEKMKQFRLYSFYSWGLALICLICTYSAQSSGLPKQWKSGIGGPDYCFIDATGSSGWIYFYGPILIILCLNTVMFVLTFMRIKKSMQAFDGPNKSQHEYKALCMAFLRLFILMGITWLTEIFAYAFASKDSVFSFLFRITDLLNGSQGIIIFILFVCRPSVRNQILKLFGKADISVSKDEPSHEMTQCL